MREITSRDNPLIKRFIAISSDKAKRGREKLFTLEGARLCLDALGSMLVFREVYATEKALQKYPAIKEIFEKAGDAFMVSEPVALKMSDAKTPQGVFAVCEKPCNNMPEDHKQNARYLLLAALQDAGNVGAIIRTAEAFGLDGIVMTEDCPDPYSPKVLRASMGGVFRLPVCTVSDMTGEIARLKSQGVKVYAATLGSDAEKLGNIRFDGVCAVLLGNEGAGLPATLIEACGNSLIIPMAGRADSLSVAMAAGIFAWEMKA